MSQANEFEVIVFESDRIVTYESESENESSFSCNSEEYYEEDIEDETDIFDDNHVWDLIPNMRFRFHPEFWRWAEGELRYDE
tara:strand:+ start:948 stop:1193 length:246 start_codon:yes stop_codon:yes gene_type:complete